MANQTPFSLLLAFFGSTCHYLEATSKMLAYFPSQVVSSSPIVMSLAIANAVLALGYIVFAWHLIGFSAKALAVAGLSLAKLHKGIGDLSLRGLRFLTGITIRLARAFSRWLR